MRKVCFSLDDKSFAELYELIKVMRYRNISEGIARIIIDYILTRRITHLPEVEGVTLLKDTKRFPHTTEEKIKMILERLNNYVYVDNDTVRKIIMECAGKAEPTIKRYKRLLIDRGYITPAIIHNDKRIFRVMGEKREIDEDILKSIANELRGKGMIEDKTLYDIIAKYTDKDIRSIRGYERALRELNIIKIRGIKNESIIYETFN